MGYWYKESKGVRHYVDGLPDENHPGVPYALSVHLGRQEALLGRFHSGFPPVAQEWKPKYSRWTTIRLDENQLKEWQKPGAYKPYDSRTQPTPKPTVVEGKGLRGPLYSAKYAREYCERTIKKRQTEQPVLCVLVQVEGERFWAPWDEAKDNPRWVIIHEGRKR